jgi:hypothetical protein
MARKTKVVVVCDRHRGEVEATTTVEIAIDGTRRQLDLCAEHAGELRRTLRPWLRSSSGSTRGGAASGRGRKRTAAASRPRRSTDGPAIRAWAREQGYDIPERGRIPAAVREAYYAK